MKLKKTRIERLIEEDVKYVWHHFKQMSEYAKKPLVIVKGEGAYVEDIHGKRYLDAASGVQVVNIGYGNRYVVESMKKQLDEFTYGCLIYSTSIPTIRLAKKLSEIAPKGLEKVFFTDSGSDAVETAIKMARQYHFQTGKPIKFKTISRWLSYHGATLGALSATGRTVHRLPFEPNLLRFPHVPPPYCYRCPFGKEYPDCDMECARFVEKTIKLEGADSIASFIAEPIIGTTGAGIVPPDEYFPMIHEICTEHNVLLILDEVLTGFGRTGKMFAAEHWKLVPDILVGGKGVSGGYAPLSFSITKPSVWEAFLGEKQQYFAHGHTYGGNALSCVAALACIEVIEKEKLVERSAVLGEYLRKQLRSLDHKIIGDVRGKGMMAGIELVKDKKTKKIFTEENVGPKVAQAALKKGVIIFGLKSPCPGVISDLLWITPPLIITKDQVDTIVEVVDQSISEVEKTYSII